MAISYSDLAHAYSIAEFLLQEYKHLQFKISALLQGELPQDVRNELTAMLNITATHEVEIEVAKFLAGYAKSEKRLRTNRNANRAFRERREIHKREVEAGVAALYTTAVREALEQDQETAPQETTPQETTSPPPAEISGSTELDL